MSIELLTDTTAGITRPKPAEPAGEPSAAKRSSQKEQAAEAGRVSLDATRELDELVQVVRKAPTEVSESRLEDLATQVRNGDYTPNMRRTALAILEELDLLPDPPHDTLP